MCVSGFMLFPIRWFVPKDTGNLVTWITERAGLCFYCAIMTSLNSTNDMRY